MAWTSHGHQIPNTTVEEPRPSHVARCGRVENCPTCREEAAAYLAKKDTFEAEILKGDNSANYPSRARKIVAEHIDSLFPKGQAPVYEVYTPWFSKVLSGWKAMVSSTIPDGRYYEVTYNGEKNETYLDVYQKISNTVIPD